MLTSLAYIFLIGLTLASICKKIRLPRIIGMLITGIVLGPCVLKLLDDKILGISSDLRQMALVIILIKAGLSLNVKDLKRVGRPAILMSFLPAVFEICAYTIFAPMILHVSYIEGALMGAVMGAVSPAVVVPKMVQLMDENYGTDKQIPQLILAGSSLDDVFVIVLFSTFLSMAEGGSANIIGLIDIPVSIVLGVGLGVAVGFLLSWFFETNYSRNNFVRNSVKVIIVLGFSFLFLAIEDWLDGIVAVSGLLAVLSMAMTLAMRSVSSVTKRLQAKFGKLWLAAELLLFVLVGAAVDITYTMKAGLGALLMVVIGLLIRSLGVYICMIGTKLNFKEKLFCIISYLPKATVQAAIGSVPLSMGLPCGPVVLSVAVISILFSAPLGAIGMDLSYKKLLNKVECVYNESDENQYVGDGFSTLEEETYIENQCDKDENFEEPINGSDK